MLRFLVLVVLSIAAESLRVNINTGKHKDSPIPMEFIGQSRSKQSVLNFKSLVNMTKDDNLRFAHIPKTGGTWVSMVLRELGFKTTQIFDMNSHYPNCQQHVPPGEAIEKGDLARSKFYTNKNVESFAVIRHPYERAVSQFGWATWYTRKWDKVLGYPYNADGMNRFIQDSLKNASKTEPLSVPWKGNHTEYTLQVHGPALQDCHWIPQADYVYNKDRTSKAIKTLLNFSSIEADLFNLAKQHSQIQPAEPQSLLELTHSKSNMDWTPNKGFHLKHWLPLLSDETKDAIDSYYADDFGLMGFSKYRSETPPSK